MKYTELSISCKYNNIIYNSIPELHFDADIIQINRNSVKEIDSKGNFIALNSDLV